MLSRIVVRADRLQQRHRALGFAYAVIRKFLDDGGTREAALITYYGFLSIFPIVLLGVTAVSLLLARCPEVGEGLVDAMVPATLRADVGNAADVLRTSGTAVIVGLMGLLFSGAGVVTSAYRTLNHVAAVPYRSRRGIVRRYLGVLTVLAIILAGTMIAGALTVVMAVFPGLPRLVATLGTWLVACVVLLLAARLLLDRPAPMCSLWPAAVPGAAAVTLMVNLGAALLPGLVRRAGAVYGSFATVAGLFTLLYLLSIALVGAAEIAAVRQARLWPRALDRRHPTAGDARALQLLAREQERVPGQRIESVLPSDPTGLEACTARPAPRCRHCLTRDR